MRNRISITGLRDFVHILRAEAMDACQEAHEVSDGVEPRKKAALKERGEIKKAIASRIEEMIS